MIKPKRLPVIREDRTIEIHLTKGYVAIVDWEDAWACGFTWTALKTPTGHVYASCRSHLLHREIVASDLQNGVEVDHKNGDTLNCRRSNLRVVTHRRNTQNRKMHRNNTSGFMGVSGCGSTWTATLSGRYLGTFRTAEEANDARLAAEREEWGLHPQRLFAHGLDIAVYDLPHSPPRGPFIRLVNGVQRAYVPRCKVV